jgi:hypothetical protein
MRGALVVVLLLLLSLSLSHSLPALASRTPSLRLLQEQGEVTSPEAPSTPPPQTRRGGGGGGGGGNSSNAIPYEMTTAPVPSLARVEMVAIVAALGLLLVCGAAFS